MYVNKVGRILCNLWQLCHKHGKVIKGIHTKVRVLPLTIPLGTGNAQHVAIKQSNSMLFQVKTVLSILFTEH